MPESDTAEAHHEADAKKPRHARLLKQMAAATEPLPSAKIDQIFTPFMYWLYGYSEKRFHKIWSRWNARMSS